MISARNVTFRYPGAERPALDDVTLTIRDAGFVLIAGSSGSGKSTFVRALCGLVPHFTGGTFAGSVTVGGRDTRTHPPRDLADVIGFVAQDPESQAVVDRVDDEIVFAMENLAIGPLVMRKRLEEVLDALGIEHLRSRRLATLSGGERQRVAIAAALAAQPLALVLDEPTSQLDPQSAEDVLGALHRLNDDLGIAIILVEHRLERVVQHASEMVVIEAGRIVHRGTPREVLASGPVATPLSTLARALDWRDMPLTVREGRALARSLRVTPQPPARVAGGDVLVEARGLHVTLGGTDVLRGADLTVRRGETVAVIGRNGAGKTTLLRSLMGLVDARDGTRTIAGMDPATVPLETIARRVAYVPQTSDAILFHETVAGEIDFTLRGRRAPDVARDVIEQAGLAPFTASDPRDLSAGQRLRVAILAATAGRPDVVLLDEPTRGMDARGKEFLAGDIDRWRSCGCVVLVTHDVELVARVATRVVLVVRGEVVLDGPVTEVLGESPLFGSQMNKVFGDSRILTVEHALEAVGAR